MRTISVVIMFSFDFCCLFLPFVELVNILLILDPSTRAIKYAAVCKVLQKSAAVRMLAKTATKRCLEKVSADQVEDDAKVPEEKLFTGRAAVKSIDTEVPICKKQYVDLA